MSWHMPKLAPLSIPYFSGDWRQWTPFIGLFDSVIHHNPRLAPVQKLQYLQNYLKGDAAKRIGNLALTNESYPIAYQLIQRLYNNRRRITEEHVGQLLDLPKLQHRSAQGLLNIITALETSLEGLRKSTNQDVESLACFVVSCVTRKLDEDTLERFEESIPDKQQIPSIKSLQDFLERRYHVLSSEDLNRSATSFRKKSFNAVAQASAPTHQASCRQCGRSHRLHECEAFKRLDMPSRFHLVSKYKLCFNCLGTHSGNCPSRFSCFQCKQRHHTLLHKQQSSSSSHLAKEGDKVLLATALIKVLNPLGRPELLRALVDPGSQDTFITAAAADMLMLNKTNANVSITGIGGAKAERCKARVDLHFRAHFPTNTEFHASALIMPKLTSRLPESPVHPHQVVGLPHGLILADPHYEQPGNIDVILGAAVHAEIMKDGFHKLHNHDFVVQNTQIGWLLSGRLMDESSETSVSLISTRDLDEKLRRFWEEEETTMPPMESRVEEFYNQTTTRDELGRYTVHLPRRPDVFGTLGASRNTAAARLINLEKSFNKNPKLAAEYRKFLKEYEELGHMTKVDPFSGPDEEVFYLPHHAVLKESSTTTKVRVVFNGSAKTHTGLSVNSLLEPGFKQQQDLQQILLRWRKHRIVVTGDIEKMFRQILVTPKDRDLQRILWRHDSSDPIAEYQLNTVTYGTAPATFLAINTIRELAKTEERNYPEGAAVALRDFYVDDLLTGEDSIDAAEHIQKQVTCLLAKGGFIIRKWATNSTELMGRIPEDMRESGDWLLNPEATIKTLGIVWNPQRDEFQMRVDTEAFSSSNLTKRQLLSQIATIFDPLGLVAPITFMGRVWMQELWLEHTDWDELISPSVQAKWDRLREKIHLLNQVSVPRWTGNTRSTKIQLHGFCDASEKGYAAVVYSRVTDLHGNIQVRLLTAKSKVAPLKNKQTLPRLELAGAVLLVNLVSEAAISMQLEEAERVYWCDSQITLAWIAKEPTQWNTFVGNRVATIQRLSNPLEWHYVNTKENPADVASRGCSPEELLSHSLWWTGPRWLSLQPEDWPTAITAPSTEMEMKPRVTLAANVCKEEVEFSLVHRFSSFKKTTRVVAWMLRFATRARGPLGAAELEKARMKVLLLMQEESFSEERRILKLKQLPKSSQLHNLTPFLDELGLIRVGGRLRHAEIPRDSKHPVFLPRDHPLTSAIIRETHIQTLHGGAQLTLSLLRRSYWITNGRAKVQSVIRQCRTCQRFAPVSQAPFMGDIPAKRINPAPAFTYTGVDYCGPFLTRCSKGRGIATTKCYIAVFVCFTTKAIHLELVSDLTTDAFLAGFKRFTSRRGLPLEMNSDNGLNFQGAAKELKRMLQNAVEEATNTAAALMANDGMTWKFIPVASPHFGGLWEAGVKSVKKHLKRTLGEHKLTFEELYTLLCQIEACLNSRPIAALSSDPEDSEALTPGHFLITRPIVAPPEPWSTMDAPRWKQITKLHQQFWERWSEEYRTELQTRHKWTANRSNPSTGALVLLKERNLPPTKWALGRIREVHPGDDGRVRVVTIDTEDRKDLNSRW